MPTDIGAQLTAMLPRLRRFALTLCRSRELADDLVQSACERALATHAGPAAETPFDAWMFCILRNLWIDNRRRQRKEGLAVDIEEYDDVLESRGTVEVDARVDLDRVRRAIERLPDEQREVLLLVCVEELSYKDAAVAIGAPIGTIMSRLSRARLKLAEITGLSKPRK
jgi:RNA polymerase sigma-70 factor (ECF subfamily)